MVVDLTFDQVRLLSELSVSRRLKSAALWNCRFCCATVEYTCTMYAPNVVKILIAEKTVSDRSWGWIIYTDCVQDIWPRSLSNQQTIIWYDYLPQSPGKNYISRSKLSQIHSSFISTTPLAAATLDRLFD